MSNTIGTINPIEKIIKIAKKHDIQVLIDAAQSASHIKIDVKKLNCDFLVFSAHKMMGPTGLGILYIKKSVAKSLPPFLRGGHMIKEVSSNTSTWNDLPWKFEAGTQKIAQVISFGEALKYINSLTINKIYKHEQILLEYFLNKLNNIDNITIYGHNSISGPIVSFNIDNYHSYDIAKLLDTFKIAIRSGHHCTQPLMKSLKTNFTIRVSFYAYNDFEDIEYFMDSLEKTINVLK